MKLSPMDGLNSIASVKSTLSAYQIIKSADGNEPVKDAYYHPITSIEGQATDYIEASTGITPSSRYCKPPNTWNTESLALFY
jgi:hypothetical protein